jgi:hypothetical protein
MGSRSSAFCQMSFSPPSGLFLFLKQRWGFEEGCWRVKEILAARSAGERVHFSEALQYRVPGQAANLRDFHPLILFRLPVLTALLALWRFTLARSYDNAKPSSSRFPPGQQGVPIWRMVLAWEPPPFWRLC